MPKESDADERQEFARHLVRQWEAEPSHTLTALADRLEVSTGFLSQLKSRRTGAGIDVIAGLAEVFGWDLAEFEARRREWVAAGCPGEWVERPERYPNRSRAARAARELGVSEDAIRRVLSFELKGEDWTPREWLTQMQAMDSQIQLGVDAGTPVPEEMEEATRPKIRKKKS